ncbi:hypothetical protein Tco_1571398 [Tanacetum coccineum]
MAITYAIFEGENSESNVINTIRKGNLLLDLQKLQKNRIFCILVDIRQNTNFVSAFTTSANVHSIYIQLFWNTLTHDVKTGVYSFQVNEHWLTLSADLLRKALNRWIIASQDETTGPSVHPEDATSTKMVHETLSHADAEFGGNSEKINSETDTEILMLEQLNLMNTRLVQTLNKVMWLLLDQTLRTCKMSSLLLITLRILRIHEWEADDEELAYVPIGKCNRVLERQKKLRNQIFRALAASADVPSSVTETTDTTSTLPPPPPPLQNPTCHRDIKEKVKPYNANDVTDLLEQNERLRAEIEKVKQHYKEISVKKNKVLAPGMYAIDVKPIPHPLKNNRSAHLNYINHLKESVETVREIVEEARVVKPLDNALNYACQYTKLSQGID